MIDEEAHLDPTIGWDKNILSHFNYCMTQYEYNNQAGIKVMVKVWIEYEWVAELGFNEDKVKQLLLMLGWPT